MRIEVLYGGEVVHVHEVGSGPVHLGRAPVNEVVLRAADVSGHHAVVWVEGGQLLFEDLGSTNGSWLGDEKLVERRSLAVGEVVRLGRETELRVGQSSAVHVAPLVLERADGRVSWGVSGARFPVPVDGDVVLLIDVDGDHWLAVDGMEQQRVTVGEPFEALGERFVLRQADGELPDTARAVGVGSGCTVEVRLGEPVAVITGPDGARCTTRSEHRVALLYALGRRWLDDAPGPGRGWMDDEDASSAIWGRSWRDRGSNTLNVLVHRMRQALDKAGLDRWIIEKRPGSIRLKAVAVTLD